MAKKVWQLTQSAQTGNLVDISNNNNNNNKYPSNHQHLKKKKKKQEIRQDGVQVKFAPIFSNHFVFENNKLKSEQLDMKQFVDTWMV